MKKTNINLIPDTVNPSPDYYCTWQTQLYATCDGKPKGQRAIIGEKAMFDKEKPYGWAYFYEKARGDLFFVMDDSWDVPLEDNPDYYGSLILNNEKFPEATNGAENNTEALKRLSDRMKALGWKGLGGWVCAQESKKFNEFDTPEEYWAQKCHEANQSGFAYWKVDWGEKCENADFRNMQTAIAKKYAPNLVVEHAKVKEIISDSDVFRTYDVPAIISIPLTMSKLSDILADKWEQKDALGLIDCEDEAYIAAAGGFSMGIMRHPYAGAFTDGREDMSFPSVHRNLKTKMYEVVRAARWHRIAPAFGVGGKAYVDEQNLTDSWEIQNKDEEFEAWWFDVPFFAENISGNVIKMTAPAQIARGHAPAIAEADKNGNVPFIVLSQNPNGVLSIATLGRTHGRTYEIPLCRVSISAENADTIGVFGEYRELIIETNKQPGKILMQDIAGDTSIDITDDVTVCENKIIIPGELIHSIGTSAQPEDDTSEPGCIIKIS